MFTIATGYGDDQGDSFGHGQGLAHFEPVSETNLCTGMLALERQLRLQYVEPRTLKHFADLRASLHPERYEAMLTGIAELLPVWRQARYRVYGSIAEEFAHFCRTSAERGRVVNSATIERFGDELRKRGPGELRDRLSQPARGGKQTPQS